MSDRVTATRVPYFYTTLVALTGLLHLLFWFRVETAFSAKGPM